MTHVLGWVAVTGVLVDTVGLFWHGCSVNLPQLHFLNHSSKDPSDGRSKAVRSVFCYKTHWRSKKQQL